MNRLGWALGLVIVFGGLSSGASAQSLEEEQAAMGSDDAGGGDDAGGDAATTDDGSGTTDDGSGGLGEPSDGSMEDEQAAMEEDPARLDDEQAEIADEENREVYRDSTDPIELENEDYFFLGGFGRAVIIPAFMQGPFVDGPGIDGFNAGAGLTFNWRRNNFNVMAQVWWNGAEGEGYFRAQGDPAQDTEFIDANLGVVFINAAFLWSFPVTDWFAFELGFDLGIGFIYGELIRTEAHETSTGSGEFQTCVGPGNPAGVYCEAIRDPAANCYAANDGHYNCSEPNWLTEDGDLPFVFPWVSVPHLAVRFKPIHQFQIRIDGGWGLYNFFFGGSLSYGF